MPRSLHKRPGRSQRAADPTCVTATFTTVTLVDSSLLCKLRPVTLPSFSYLPLYTSPNPATHSCPPKFPGTGERKRRKSFLMRAGHLAGREAGSPLVGFRSGLEVILSLWPRLTSSSALLGVCMCRGGGFSDLRMCQARSALAWPTHPGFLSPVPAWRSLCSGERKGHFESPLCSSCWFLPASSRVGTTGKGPPLSGRVGWGGAGLG